MGWDGKIIKDITAELKLILSELKSLATGKVTDITADVDAIKEDTDAIKTSSAAIKTATEAIQNSTADEFLQKAYTGAIITAQKTVTATPALAFAGGSALANRRRMIVRNESTDIRIRYGTGSASLQENGFPIEPGEQKEFVFDPDTAQDIYLVSEGAEVNVFIEEK